jgi:hypothetical protein
VCVCVFERVITCFFENKKREKSIARDTYFVRVASAYTRYMRRNILYVYYKRVYRETYDLPTYYKYSAAPQQNKYIMLFTYTQYT